MEDQTLEFMEDPVNHQDLVVIATAASTGESTAMADALEQAGIPSAMDACTMVMPWAGSPGETHIRVPRALAKEAFDTLLAAGLVKLPPEAPVREGVADLISRLKANKSLAAILGFSGIGLLVAGFQILNGTVPDPQRWQTQAAVPGALLFTGGAAVGLGALVWIGRFRLTWLLGVILFAGALVPR